MVLNSKSTTGVVAVTGASRGIGRSAARYASGLGLQVYGCARETAEMCGLCPVYDVAC